jgi:hypothetical protein
MPAETLPPTSELFPSRQFIPRHPHLFNKHRVDWAIRNRETNGLTQVRAIYKSPCGEFLIHEPKFIEWFLGLSGRAKPRRERSKS